MQPTEPAIQVENLGKSYQIAGSAAAGGRHQYVALRDVLAERVRNIFRPSGAKKSKAQEFWALQGVTITIEQGQAVGVIGRNGAGKSTFLKLLSRIADPTTGRMRIRGRVATLLEVGTGFHPELSARENIFLNGAILGMSRSEIIRLFDEIVAFAEVEKFLEMPVKRYSSGMYMRLAFAVAAHLQPEILLLDEVLAVGDAQFQQKCLGRMRTVANGGKTVLFVSHSMAAIRNLCQKVIWLDQGRVRQFGDTNAVIDAYSEEITSTSPDTSNLEHRPRPNFVDGRAVITKISINDSKAVCHGEPFKIRLQVRANTALVGLAAAFGFSSIDGARLLTFDSDLTQPRWDLASSGPLEFVAEVPALPLQPGHYLLDVGLRSGDSTSVDHLGGCSQLTILPGKSTPSFIANAGSGVRMDAKWSFVAHGSENNGSSTGFEG